MTNQYAPAHTTDDGSAVAVPGARVDVALLVLRVGLGIVMVAHGVQKFMQGMEGTAGFFGSLGIPMPQVAAPLVAGLEVVGGIALVLGVLTRVFAALMTVSLLVALFTVHLGAGFYVADGGYEFVLILAVGMIALVIAGPGRYSLLGGVQRVPAFLR